MKKRLQPEGIEGVKRIKTCTADLLSTAFPSPSSTTSLCDETAFSKSSAFSEYHLNLKSASLPPLQIVPTLAPKNLNHLNTPQTPKYANLPSLLVPSPVSRVRSVEDLKSPNRELVNLLDRENYSLPSLEYVEKTLKKPDTRSSNLLLFTLVQVQWMAEIARRLRFIPETAFVAINFFDRYHSARKVTFKRQNQLLALTCVYMAGKLLEELIEPTIKEIVAICEFDCTVAEVKVFHCLILAYGTKNC
jgi:Cyclin, N-terminal domain